MQAVLSKKIPDWVLFHTRWFFFLLNFFLFFASNTYCSDSLTIKIECKNFPGKPVYVAAFSDYMTRSRLLVGKGIMDQNGLASIRIECRETQVFELVCGSLRKQAVLSPEQNCTIFLVDNGRTMAPVKVEHSEEGINDKILRLATELEDFQQKHRKPYGRFLPTNTRAYPAFYSKMQSTYGMEKDSFFQVFYRFSILQLVTWNYIALKDTIHLNQLEASLSNLTNADLKNPRVNQFLKFYFAERFSFEKLRHINADSKQHTIKSRIAEIQLVQNPDLKKLIRWGIYVEELKLTQETYFNEAIEDLKNPVSVPEMEKIRINILALLDDKIKLKTEYLSPKIISEKVNYCYLAQPWFGETFTHLKTLTQVKSTGIEVFVFQQDSIMLQFWKEVYPKLKFTIIPNHTSILTPVSVLWVDGQQSCTKYTPLPVYELHAFLKTVPGRCRKIRKT
jgi:hypothetical protein